MLRRNAHGWRLARKNPVNGMFDRLRQFLEEMTGPDPAEREFGEGDFRLAAAALLVHVAEIDGLFDLAERRSLLLLLQQRFDLDAEAAGRLLAAAQKSDREAVDLYGFTSILQESMSLPERRRVIEMMWTIAYADGEAQEFEENIIWRVSELLGVSANDRIALRRKIRAESGCDPDAAGPWETEPAADSGAKGRPA
jgi:uncharacterized tellurite resistance protein B-like protein